MLHIQADLSSCPRPDSHEELHHSKPGTVRGCGCHLRSDLHTCISFKENRAAQNDHWFCKQYVKNGKEEISCAQLVCCLFEIIQSFSSFQCSQETLEKMVANPSGVVVKCMVCFQSFHAASCEWWRTSDRIFQFSQFN